MDKYTPIEPDFRRSLKFRNNKLLYEHVIKHVLNRNEKWKNIIDPDKITHIRHSVKKGRYPVKSEDFQYIAGAYETIISQIVLHACKRGRNHTHFIDKAPNFASDVLITVINKQYIHVFDPKKRIIIILSALFKDSNDADISKLSLKYKVNTAYRLTKLVLKGSNINSYIKLKMMQSSPIHPNCKLIADHR